MSTCPHLKIETLKGTFDTNICKNFYVNTYIVENAITPINDCSSW